jgi:hypothetical protein
MLAADPQFRERFDRGARDDLAGRASAHPRVHDAGEHEGTAFLVLQYLDGETLYPRWAATSIPEHCGCR